MLPFRGGQLQRYTTNTDLYTLSDGFEHDELDALFEDTKSSMKSVQQSVESKPHKNTTVTTAITASTVGPKSTKRHKRWWHELDDVDPISLEPLAELKYPPFQLKSSNDLANECVESICFRIYPKMALSLLFLFVCLLIVCLFIPPFFFFFFFFFFSSFCPCLLFIFSY